MPASMDTYTAIYQQLTLIGGDVLADLNRLASYYTMHHSSAPCTTGAPRTTPVHHAPFWCMLLMMTMMMT